MAKFLENIDFCRESVENLRSLLNLGITTDQNFRDYVTLVEAKTGKIIGWYGDMNDIGREGGGCDPEYEEVGIANGSKRWDLGDWVVPLKICYEDLEGTIAEYTLNKGTNIGDLTTGEFMAEILRPALDKQIKRMFWRMGWFGNKTAQNVDAGGGITNGIATDLFTTCDGIWKRVFERTAEAPEQYTAISANNEATFAAQKAAILKTGVATGILDDMFLNANSDVRGDGEAVVYTTELFARALSRDVRERWSTIMPWEKIFDGVKVSEYEGVKIVAVNIWDQMIAKYEKDGDRLNKPFRMVYGNKREFLVGTSTGDVVTDLDIWFDKKERRNYIYATGKIGTNLLIDDRFHAAY